MASSSVGLAMRRGIGLGPGQSCFVFLRSKGADFWYSLSFKVADTRIRAPSSSAASINIILRKERFLSSLKTVFSNYVLRIPQKLCGGGEETKSTSSVSYSTPRLIKTALLLSVYLFHVLGFCLKIVFVSFKAMFQNH